MGALEIDTLFGRGERDGMKKKKKNFENIFLFPLFGSLSRREWKSIERSFICLRV